ncbi:hypothetical protein [Paenibacillus sp. Marseille-Q4541]|uniref:hypothetical protein n=1 Tax=Paenibacillus sp. Marseille-Q4541 TaxID=2831522 RepID=UPI001BAA9FA7|nr:hypothetical protein [Paenibacillus sp. Marseille-Q4541]
MDKEELGVWEREISSRVDYLEQEAEKLGLRIKKAEYKDQIMSNAMNQFAEDEEQINFIKQNYLNESSENVKTLRDELHEIEKELKFQRAVLHQIEQSSQMAEEEE